MGRKLAALALVHDAYATSSHGSAGFSAASAGVLILLVTTSALCMWWNRRRKSAPAELADKEQLRKDLLQAHDSVVVAKKRITGEEVKAAASIPAVYASSDDGNGSGVSAAAAGNRVPMVGFLDLPEEEQQRLRAGNINDSVLIMRNKRATSGNGSASPAKGGEAAVAYYQQHLEKLRRSSSGSRGSSGAGAGEGVQMRGRSSDGSESGKRVQFGAAQVLAVCSAPGSAAAAGSMSASEAGDVPQPGEAAAAAAGHAGTAGNVLLPGGVDGDSISIDTSGGERHSRGDDTARMSGAVLPGSAS